MVEQGRYRGRITELRGRQVAGRPAAPHGVHRVRPPGRYDAATGQLVPCPAATRTYYKAITPKTIDWLAGRPQGHRLRQAGPGVPRSRGPGRPTCSASRSTSSASTRPTTGQVRERWSIHRESSREKLAPRRAGDARRAVRRHVQADPRGRQADGGAGGQPDEHRRPHLTRRRTRR